MRKIIGFEKDGKANKILMDVEGVPTMFFLVDGRLEQYMGTFGLGAGAALTTLMADAFIEGHEMPDMDAPDAQEKIAAMMRETPDLFTWEIDRDEVLAQITLADDTAEQVRNTWAAAAEELRAAQVVDDDGNAAIASRSQVLASGYERRSDELLADDIVAEMPKALTNQPRDLSTPEIALGALPLEVRFVD